MLDRVTITGPDDSIDARELAELSAEFPFVEWGILVSKRAEDVGGSPRYPSHPFIRAVQDLLPYNPKMLLSLHVCGRWVRDLLVGRMTVPTQLLIGFKRVQLNFHAEAANCEPQAFHRALLNLSHGGNRQYIFQLDGAKGNSHLEDLYLCNGTPAIGGFVDAVPLFDISGGAGILPDEWPAAFFKEGRRGHPENGKLIYHGYAGGLGPENLEREIPRILEAAGDCRVWIDMETRVRSNGDAIFDLAKVRRCLEIAKPFITKENQCATDSYATIPTSK